MVGGAGQSDHGGGRRARTLRFVLARPLGTKGDARSHRRPLEFRRPGSFGQKRYADHGQTIPPPERQSPEALGKLQKAEIEKWWPIIKNAGINAG